MHKNILVAMAVLMSGWAGADDFGSALTTSVQELPASVDLAGMGGMNMCVPTPSGSNPAQYPTLAEFECKTAPFLAEYSLHFKSGPDVNMSVMTVTTKAGDGFLRLNYYKLGSSNLRSKNLLIPQNADGETLEIGYGLKLSDKLNVGMSLTPLLNSTSTASLGRLKIGTGTARGEFTMTLGALYRPVKKVSIGLCYNHSLQEIRSEQLGFISKTNVKTDFLRLGVAVQPWQGGTFGVEWMGGWMKNDAPIRDVFSQKWFCGGEQWLNKHFAVRAGCLDGQPTAGLGIALGKKPSCFIDYAYVSNPAGDLRGYWGKAGAHLVSFCCAF